MAVYSKTETRTATIANTATTSDVVDLGASAVLAIEMPGTITGTNLAIHGCSTSGGTYGVIRDAGGTANIFVVAANGKYEVRPQLTAGWPYIKIVMDAQSQSTAVILLVRPV